MLEDSTSFREEELLASSIAGLIGDARHVAIGASSPIPAAAAMLARERGGGRPYVSLLGSRRQNFFTDGGRELFDCAGQGRIDAFFLSGAQIDGEANINLVSIGDYAHPKARFAGLVRIGLSLLCGAEGDPVPSRAHPPHLGGKGRFHQRAGSERGQRPSSGRTVRPHHQSLPVRVRPRATALHARERASRAYRRRGRREHRVRLRSGRGCADDASAVARGSCASCERRWRRSWSRSIPSSPPMCSGCDKLPDTRPASRRPWCRPCAGSSPCPSGVARGCHIG